MVDYRKKFLRHPSIVNKVYNAEKNFNTKLIVIIGFVCIIFMLGTIAMLFAYGMVSFSSYTYAFFSSCCIVIVLCFCSVLFLLYYFMITRVRKAMRILIEEYEKSTMFDEEAIEPPSDKYCNLKKKFKDK